MSRTERTTIVVGSALALALLLAMMRGKGAAEPSEPAARPRELSECERVALEDAALDEALRDTWIGEELTPTDEACEAWEVHPDEEQIAHAGRLRACGQTERARWWERYVMRRELRCATRRRRIDG